MVVASINDVLGKLKMLDIISSNKLAARTIRFHGKLKYDVLTPYIVFPLLMNRGPSLFAPELLVTRRRELFSTLLIGRELDGGGRRFISTKKAEGTFIS